MAAESKANAKPGDKKSALFAEEVEWPKEPFDKKGSCYLKGVLFDGGEILADRAGYTCDRETMVTCPIWTVCASFGMAKLTSASRADKLEYRVTVVEIGPSDQTRTFESSDTAVEVRAKDGCFISVVRFFAPLNACRITRCIVTRLESE